MAVADAASHCRTFYHSHYTLLNVGRGLCLIASAVSSHFFENSKPQFNGFLRAAFWGIDLLLDETGE